MKITLGLTIILLTSTVPYTYGQDESLAGSFLSGLLDTITSTENSKDCPGVCVHALATLICYEVLEDIKCPTPSMKCCVESSSAATNLSTSTHRPVTTTTERTTTEHVKHSTSSKYSEKKDNECPGVCVADRIADYCEAYLKTPNLCKVGTKCCVAKDSYMDNPDLRVLIGSHNSSKAPMKPQKTSEKVHSEPPKSKTNPPQKYSKPQPTKKPFQQSQKPSGQGQVFNECEGECVSGLFALFCDDIDTNAYCPNEGSCCTPAGGANDKEVVSTTQRITTRPPLPRCPGFCLLNIMAAFCEKPAVVIQRTSSCSSGSICCDNTRVPVTRRPPPTTRRPPPTTTHAPTTTLPPDPREECPGSCIVSLLSFTCFRNAEMTELFKCKKSGTQCCAPKTKIQEQLDKHNRNYTYPYNPNLGPVNPNYPHPQQYYNNNYPPSNYPPPPPPPAINYQQQAVNNYPPPSAHIYEPTISQPSTITYEIVEPTTSPRPPPYSKYVCGVKGTIRTGKEYLVLQGNSTTRSKRNKEFEREVANVYKNKNTERLVLGSSLVPIPIIYEDNSTFSFNMANHHHHQRRNLNLSHRQARVVGGEDGDNGEWCWQVALINSQNQYLCGGALIGTQWVLTAAHCVTNIVRSGDAIYVRVGDYDLTRKYGSPGAQTLKVATTYIHHNHNSQTLDNDIALLKLLGQADLKEGVCLVCLPARGVSHAAGKRCTVTGYGYMGESGPIPLRVREAEIPIVSDTECIRKINAVTEKIFILPASSFCAGGISGNDACQGDGGGPLVCQDDGFFELAGLVSWGFGCGREDVPGVYVKVSSFIGWINQIISVNNS
ncbi:CLUMA_CG006034, isoform A [Clunio marinus]|uniref:CLUMA_CG006034, isoform A n=1 Tax=Clunio marinus TaxID=568069 RepID=A0A1J1HYT9_9DIPT|nr:CLUMA_CG006034, isoform A [Clunio marinus]